MINTVVFDMGGVIGAWNVDQILSKLPIAPKSKYYLKQEMFGSPEWILVDGGFLSEEEMLERVKKRIPESTWEDAAFALEHFTEYSLEPIPETLEIVKKLKRKGYRMYLLSNASTRFDTYKDRFEAFTLMDGLFVSAKYHCLKPDQTIYRRFFDTFELNPQNCVFIDDSAANIAGSLLAGMDGIVYKQDPEALIRALQKRGIDID